jgi:hypothetical protein
MTKYHPIYDMDQKEKDELINELIAICFEGFLDGKDLTMGQMMGAMVKAIDVVMAKRFF